jgi:transposase
VELLSPTKRTLERQLEHIENLRSEVLSVTREIRELSRSEYYAEKMRLIQSVPGIGMITAMNMLVELERIERFNNEKSFASYLGLIPTCRNSGEKTRTGEITFRGNNRLRTMLIESSWVAIRRDIALAAAYSGFCKRMKPQNAIIRIARKLSNRIFAVLKSGNIYEYDKCCQ